MKYDFTSLINRHNMDAIAVDSWGEIPGMAPNAPDEGFARIAPVARLLGFRQNLLDGFLRPVHQSQARENTLAAMMGGSIRSPNGRLERTELADQPMEDPKARLDIAHGIVVVIKTHAVMLAEVDECSRQTLLLRHQHRIDHFDLGHFDVVGSQTLLDVVDVGGVGVMRDQDVVSQ